MSAPGITAGPLSPSVVTAGSTVLPTRRIPSGVTAGTMSPSVITSVPPSVMKTDFTPEPTRSLGTH